ncbi:hypothetical protein BCV70DRAFT_198747 [Testicularia cyperi]|uniref:Coiled-coil domain-containing protein 16 n=1 Tax=Testicularia cyperi TaxID=1882483 RepID=A0A317XVJ1_9BASI|nr:hypothetical protein BCV70DRAFT_198747 [Testicularia cyperi]
MPSDARSLLRAAASERARTATLGITDPFASYSGTGGLRCSACNFLPLKHESLWSAHAASKSHRANAARIREEGKRKQEQEHEEQLRQAELQRTKDGKRKAIDSDHDDGTSDSTDKQDGVTTKKSRTQSIQDANGAGSVVDAEWEMFKAQMEVPDASAMDSSSYAADATIEVQPQLRTDDGNADSKDATEDDQKIREEQEAEERTRKEQEEKEEIYARFEEEQRLQDEADERVTALKQRLERIKQARLAKQKSKNKGSNSDSKTQ